MKILLLLVFIIIGSTFAGHVDEPTGEIIEKKSDNDISKIYLGGIFEDLFEFLDNLLSGLDQDLRSFFYYLFGILDIEECFEYLSDKRTFAVKGACRPKCRPPFVIYNCDNVNNNIPPVRPRPPFFPPIPTRSPSPFPNPNPNPNPCENCQNIYYIIANCEYSGYIQTLECILDAIFGYELIDYDCLSYRFQCPEECLYNSGYYDKYADICYDFDVFLDYIYYTYEECITFLK
ncbi:uncharacterized protein LOC111624145 isoform X2 [Centruroides sculpturatus]|uniref:uncharacterized protein LOC111624145 isoform X2 n=1 Tax=Centruroides sculpturatus TaxID=218467 RepID=UPI000C6EEBF2|nr:uncharacterized protein LOC111624145 isoform X2 [Centruroides sculpturatus]